MGPARESIGRVIASVLPDVAQVKRDALVAAVLRAAASATSLNESCEAAPLEYSRRELARVMGRFEFGSLAKALNVELWAVARRRLPRRFTVSVDLTDVPYHGEPDSSPDEIVQGQARDGTTWKHRFATAYVSTEGVRFTLCVFHIRAGVKPFQALTQVIERLDELELLRRIERVLIDKGFYSVTVISALKQHGLPFILPIPVKAKLVKQWRDEGLTKWETFSVGNKWTKNIAVRVAVVHVPDRGKKGPDTYSYATYRQHAHPEIIHQRYLKRGGIETSYKLNNRARARTTSRRVETRLFYFAVAMILQNTWVKLKMTSAATLTTFHRYLREINALVERLAKPQGPLGGHRN